MPGTEATWRALTNAERRPLQPRSPRLAKFLTYEPERRVQLAAGSVATSLLREDRRGVAAGFGHAGLEEEHRLLDEPSIPRPPVRLGCCSFFACRPVMPRANHALRTLPPSESAYYARAHDHCQAWFASQRSGPDGCRGELGSVDGCSPSSVPLARRGDRCLASGARKAPLGAKQRLRDLMQAEGWEACPSWQAAYNCALPQQPRDAGPWDWPRGWSSTRHGHETSTVAIAFCCRLCSLHPKPCYARTAGRTRVLRSRQCQAKLHLLSPRRPCTSLAFAPAALAPAASRSGSCIGCGQQVDQYGDRALACPRKGLLARRPSRPAWVRVAREAAQQWCTLLHWEGRSMTEDGST